MAIIKPGALVSAIAGTVGGVTFLQSVSGQTARLWRPPPRRRSPAQSIQRNYLADLGLAWRALTPTQRTAWNTYAAAPEQALVNRFGDTFYASGWNWFSKIALNRAPLALDPLEDAPTIAVPSAPAVTFGTINYASGSFLAYLNSDPNPWAAGELCVVHSAYVQGGGRTTLARATDLILLRDETASQFVYLTQQLPARYGSLAIGAQVLLHVRTQTSEGRRGPATTFFEFVTET